MLTFQSDRFVSGTFLIAFCAVILQWLAQGAASGPLGIAPQISPGVATPVRLFVPRLGVNAPIEQVGVTRQGNMDVPSGAETVGWYKLGPKPGEKGNAVISGHLDTLLGPAVFWRLNELVQGDEIVVRDARAELRTFSVVRTQAYDAANAPLEEIFGSGSGVNLQLITCNGSWVEHKRSYDKRLVVFARALSGSVLRLAP